MAKSYVMNISYFGIIFFMFIIIFSGFLQFGEMEIQTLKQFNVLLLGTCFCLVFTGFNTMGGIQTLIFNSATTNGSGGYVEGFHGNGYWR